MHMHIHIAYMNLCKKTNKFKHVNTKYQVLRREREAKERAAAEAARKKVENKLTKVCMYVYFINACFIQGCC